MTKEPSIGRKASALCAFMLLAALQITWGAACWSVRHLRYSAAALVGIVFSGLLGVTSLVVVFLVMLVVPALVFGIRRWDGSGPGILARSGSIDRLLGGPAARWLWRRWVRLNWSELARESGLSVFREGRWVGPSVSAMTVQNQLYLRVRPRAGQTVEEVVAAIDAIGTAAAAVSWWVGPDAPLSQVDLVFRMRSDPLAGSRAVSRLQSSHGAALVLLGRVEDGSEVVVNLVDAWHLAIQGMTRSGKSVLTYSLLSPLAGRADVVVCGLDPTGILLGPWSGARGEELRHVGGSHMEGAAEVLTRIVRAMDDRIAWLVTSGLDKMDHPTETAPLLVVVLEEYPGLLAAAEADDAALGRKPAERVAPRIRSGVRRLIQEGAKVGVRVALLAQRMDASIVGGAERSSLGARVTLRVDNADAVRMLHPSAPSGVAERLATVEPGVGLINVPGHPPRWFRADYMTYQQYSERVRTALGSY